MAKGPKRPTINDVARLSGVTAATVSRVLNAKKNFSVSQEVRDRIETVAREIGYVPDLAARNLNRGQTRIVGVFASPETHFAEGITEDLLEGVAGVLHPAGYDVFFQMSASERHARAVPFWRFDGAVLLQAPLDEAVSRLTTRHIPFVCVNESANGAIGNVLADDRMGTLKCLDHLRQLGHRKVGYVDGRQTYLPHYSVAVRRDTMREGAAERGMEVVTKEESAPVDMPRFLKKAVAAGATALVTYDHHLAVVALSAAAKLGLSVPRDLSLVCFNDLFPLAILQTPVTAVAVNGRMMGRTGAEQLLARMIEMHGDDEAESGDASADVEPGTVLIAEDLVVRESTAPPGNRAD